GSCGLALGSPAQSRSTCVVKAGLPQWGIRLFLRGKSRVRFQLSLRAARQVGGTIKLSDGASNSVQDARHLDDVRRRSCAVRRTRLRRPNDFELDGRKRQLERGRQLG